ncbi:hypothetical protein L228DRAFT_247150 [Xylona heveae TC161]|uniref:Uncharacterized protein n=1 Tax=Xylona heveae (strain CBS 132557 / TC161) TaxID=1328760 RepID=A0A165GYR0_XYLHT|nr:hypothetical protein L228DRAFT_247150 [Xylona heveae TC161]KZF22770.1 hypothetical protein L228DRAFT_247150 [Xylona heveae TC161]
MEMSSSQRTVHFNTLPPDRFQQRQPRRPLNLSTNIHPSLNKPLPPLPHSTPLLSYPTSPLLVHSQDLHYQSRSLFLASRRTFSENAHLGRDRSQQEAPPSMALPLLRSPHRRQTTAFLPRRESILPSTPVPSSQIPRPSRNGNRRLTEVSWRATGTLLEDSTTWRTARTNKAGRYREMQPSTAIASNPYAASSAARRYISCSRRTLEAEEGARLVNGIENRSNNWFWSKDRGARHGAWLPREEDTLGYSSRIPDPHRPAPRRRQTIASTATSTLSSGSFDPVDRTGPYNPCPTPHPLVAFWPKSRVPLPVRMAEIKRDIGSPEEELMTSTITTLPASSSSTHGPESNDEAAAQTEAEQAIDEPVVDSPRKLFRRRTLAALRELSVTQEKPKVPACSSLNASLGSRRKLKEEDNTVGDPAFVCRVYDDPQAEALLFLVCVY